MDHDRTSVLRRAAVAALRAPGRWVPGWFPLVVERVHPHIAPPSDVVVMSLDGYRLRLDVREYLQRRMYYHCHEPEEVRSFKRLLRPGDVVVDVGAHVGYFTVLAAVQVGLSGRVHAFEPVPGSFEGLEANIALNGLTNVRANRAAVADAPGEVSLGLTDASVGLGATDYTLGGTHEGVRAPVVTLDGYLAEQEPARRVRLLKMDVEGLEPRILGGMAETLRSAPPEAILLEYNATMIARHGADGGDVLDLLRTAGYRLFRTESFGRLAPLGAVPTGAAPPPESSPDRSVLETLRAGLAERDFLFNLLALQPGAADAA